MITRFGLFFGGLITAIAGVIASQFGRAVGGVFLAFPAIFPASATLIEKHEKQKKEKRDYTEPSAEGKPRVWTPLAQRWGLSVCSCLLLIVWHFIPNHRAWAVLKMATLAWLGVSVMMWMIRKRVQLAGCESSGVRLQILFAYGSSTPEKRLQASRSIS
jgi:hypothetical protein